MKELGFDLESQVENFARYEFKYLLSKAVRDEIESEVRHFMTYDGHVHPEFENSYIVRSLYFDNAEADNYYEKIDGIKTRRKFRIRTYGTKADEDLPIFLEEKGRHNNRTYKQRIRIRAEDLKIAQNPSRSIELLELYPNVSLVEGFIYDIERRRLKPRVLVDYLRRPYSSPYDMNFRITFDGALSASAVDSLYPSDTAPRYLSNAGWTILEVKFFRRIPAWFHRILQAHSMTRLSISKFCKGMEICGLAVDLS
jgi:SPX domain protein involved in polyphosphate accumulation